MSWIEARGALCESAAPPAFLHPHQASGPVSKIRPAHRRPSTGSSLLHPELLDHVDQVEDRQIQGHHDQTDHPADHHDHDRFDEAGQCADRGIDFGVVIVRLLEEDLLWENIFNFAETPLPANVLSKLTEARDKIASGSITVPSALT